MVQKFCEVCSHGNETSTNPILTCKICKVSCHRCCYPLRLLPKGKWTCAPCQKKETAVKCNFCKKEKGPFKPIHQKKGWVHSSCALHIPYVNFTKDLEEVDISNVKTPFFKLKCKFCNKIGACIQCGGRRCALAFHVSCAIESGKSLFRTIKEQPDGQNYQWTNVFCEKHDPIKNSPGGSRKRKRKLIKPPSELTANPTLLLGTKNIWPLDVKQRLNPKRRKLSGRTISRNENDQDDWSLETTTDTNNPIAHECQELLKEQWAENANIRASNSTVRKNRKSVGFSVLRDPGGEAITYAQWCLWQLTISSYAPEIKFFKTKYRNSCGVRQRRKKKLDAGHLLVAHLLDIGFSRDDVPYIITVSQKGSALQFWRKMGFTPLTRKEINGISYTPVREINPFNDTVLLRITREEFIEKYVPKGFESATDYVFKELWSPFHLSNKRKIGLKKNGVTISTLERHKHSVKTESYNLQKQKN